MALPRRLLVLLVALGALLASACSSVSDDAAGPATDGPLVVVTTTILGDVVGQVVGDDGRVEVLMAPGQDPHGFSPSAQQAQLLREADLVVANGLGLEASAHDVLEAAEDDGVRVLRVAEELDPVTDEQGDEDGDGDGDGDDGDGHAHEGGDPHIWFDPLQMADGVRLVGDALAALGVEGNWTARAAEVASDLEAVHEEVATILSAIPDECRQLVTNHDNLGHLAARYDLEVVATVLPGTSTAVDPSAQDFAALADLLRTTGVPAIFAETTQTTRLAESLAADVGRDVAVVELYTDALGPPGSGADTYAGLLTTDAQRIADALADC